ncbi:MAG: preprotein translocase subunit SecA [Xanthobacteraceae bacterium]
MPNRLLAKGTPYPECVDEQETRLDSALLNVWGRTSPALLSSVARTRGNQLVNRVLELEKTQRALSDDKLREAADALRIRLVAGRRASTDRALAFALAREAARRHTGICHYPVQLLGGVAMMRGAVAEMQTGEGKSLTALLPAVTAALMGRPVHVITVNDYLARRDAELFRNTYNALGLTMGLIQHDQAGGDRQRAYACDVTYCTNKELVFDYLRDRVTLGTRRAHARLSIDNLFDSSRGRCRGLLLRGLHFAIVDEADSVLIDEARTPLILSSVGDVLADANLYETALDIAQQLALGEDFFLLTNENTIQLTPDGKARLTEVSSKLEGLWAIRRAREELVQQALSALHLFRRDVQYIVGEGKVQIVDEYTGRVMPDRKWERGLHQLIEAKEKCAVTEREKTLARITYQRFFRRYVHLCGMTGTATETAGELRAVYGLRVVQVPTNRPLQRVNLGVRVFPSAELKWKAVVDSAKSASRQGRAVLIGTRSVHASEHVADLLGVSGLQSIILNARQDQQEAEIIAAAGQPRRITVATNMAGRGTDIRLDAAVKDAGGLHVILTEFHESNRIDRQLYGRAARQGDPGSYESIVALDDELFQRFGNKGVVRLISKVAPQRQQIPRSIGRALRAFSQAAAERIHARARRATLEEDSRLSRILGFTGSE